MGGLGPLSSPRWALVLSIALSPALAAAAGTEAPADPPPIVCTVAADATDTVTPPPAGFVPDASAEPSAPGYVWTARFRAEPGARSAYAIVVRLLDPESGESVFENEERTWVAVVHFDETSHSVIAYRYRDPEKPEELWHYDPDTHKTKRITRPASFSGAMDFLCRTLAHSGLATSVEITQQARGQMETKGQLRRHIDFQRGYRGGRRPPSS